MERSPRETLRRLFDVAVEAALPLRVLPPYIRELEPPTGRTVVVGAGKASAAMAAAFESHWDRPVEGIVVTRYGHAVPCEGVRVIEAAHPVPDDAAMEAARAMLVAVEGLSAHDLVVGLFSGGGSSLLTLPAPGVTLSQKQSVTHELLRCGASVREINAVRKRLSAIKGGRLALAASPARIVNFVVSDVFGDDPSTVASGPTIPDASTRGEALAVLERYAIDFPPERLSEPPELREVETHVVASAGESLRAALIAAQGQGIEAIGSGEVEGESRKIALQHAAYARRLADQRPANGKPIVILTGGETMVNVRGTGVGGRNVEYLAELARALDGHPRVFGMAADTDGVDGVEPYAGAYIDQTTLGRATVLGFEIGDVLARNDAHTFFAALGDSLVTGPTLTNVNDFRAILIV